MIQVSRAKPANNQFTGKAFKIRCKLVSDSCVESLIRDFAYHEVNFTISFKFSIRYVVRTEIPYQISADSNFLRSSLRHSSSWFRMHELIATALSPFAKVAVNRVLVNFAIRPCMPYRLARYAFRAAYQFVYSNTRKCRNSLR